MLGLWSCVGRFRWIWNSCLVRKSVSFNLVVLLFILLYLTRFSSHRRWPYFIQCQWDHTLISIFHFHNVGFHQFQFRFVDGRMNFLMLEEMVYLSESEWILTIRAWLDVHITFIRPNNAVIRPNKTVIRPNKTVVIRHKKTVISFLLLI